jgi:fatty-acid peroxygenase
MSANPARVPGLEHALQLLADPYRWIGRQCPVLGADVVQAICFRHPARMRSCGTPRWFSRLPAVPRDGWRLLAA